MKCRTCGCAMVVDHCESGVQATTCWHSCPLCHTRRMTSERDTLLTADMTADLSDSLADGVSIEEPEDPDSA